MRPRAGWNCRGIATLLAIMPVYLGCTDGSVVRAPGLLDSAQLAVRDARRRTFLAEQEALSQAWARSRPYLAGVVVEQPTVVAFFPPGRPVADSAAVKQRLETYRAVAEPAGWEVEQRYSRRLRVTIPRSRALYSVPVPSDSVGVVLVAPGAPPQVWFGELSESALRELLNAYLAVLRVRNDQSGIGL